LASSSARPTSSADSGPTTTRSAAISLRQGDQAGHVGDLDRPQFGDGLDPRIARRGHQAPAQRRLGDLPGQGVLATAGPDEEDVQLFHGAGMSRGGGVRSRRGGSPSGAVTARANVRGRGVQGRSSGRLILSDARCEIGQASFCLKGIFVIPNLVRICRDCLLMSKFLPQMRRISRSNRLRPIPATSLGTPIRPPTRQTDPGILVIPLLSPVS
jgi:hypothetical protein